jgi:hypothetical protein
MAIGDQTYYLESVEPWTDVKPKISAKELQECVEKAEEGFMEDFGVRVTISVEERPSAPPTNCSDEVRSRIAACQEEFEERYSGYLRIEVEDSRKPPPKWG